MQVHFPNSKCQYCPFQTSDSNELSKHICIKNLYNVQKRTLNFDNGNDVNCEFEKINYQNDSLKSSLNSTVVTSAERVNEQVEEANSSHVQKKSASQKQNQNPNGQRLLSLRSRSTSKINKNARHSDKEKNRLNKSYSLKILRNKIKCADIRKPVYKTRNSFKQSTWAIDDAGVVSSTENDELEKRIKQDNIQLLDSNCTKSLCNKKLTPKEILLEPVRLTNSSYIQCYYQSQPSISTPNHLESHIRQSTLLSCRLCSYKTNSRRLLQRHTAKNHTWDLAFVSMLFR